METNESVGSAYLATLFDSVILRDVVGRFKIRDTVGLKALAEILINMITGRISSRGL